MQLESEFDLVAVACTPPEVQSAQQGAGGGVLVQRGGGQVREAVGTGALQRLDCELRADALALSVVCDFDRDVGDVRLIGQLDVARGGHE